METTTRREIKNSIKQGFAEYIIEWYFREVGYKVFSFGYERVLTQLTSGALQLRWDNEALRRVRSMPDLAAIDPSGNFVLIEVKYRTDPKSYVEQQVLPAKKAGIHLYRYWPETLLVIVTPQNRSYIRASFIEDIEGIHSFRALSDFFKASDAKAVRAAILKFQEVFETNFMLELFDFKKDKGS
jgi:hypothetical protein